LCYIKMVHNRRARPTLRLLHELDDGWQDSAPKRAVNDGRHSDLHPLSELPHPLIAKAATWFGSNPDEDGYCDGSGQSNASYCGKSRQDNGAARSGTTRTPRCIGCARPA
jgi:hypothetical protein